MVTTTQESVGAKSLRARARIGAGGRLVIPAEIRRALGLKDGESVVLRVEDGELRVWSVREGIRRAQAIASKYIRPGESMVDELIAERRAENARDEEEARAWESARE
jgi:AbrB family looped-hinge helix DNA binding protein